MNNSCYDQYTKLCYLEKKHSKTVCDGSSNGHVSKALNCKKELKK